MDAPALITLYMIFADGFLGGGPVATAEFKSMAACQKFGQEMVMQNGAQGHPATFHCMVDQPADKRYRPTTVPLQKPY